MIMVIFALTGAVIVLLIAAKSFELKRGKHFVIFRLISLGDSSLRALLHSSATLYTTAKERTLFFLKKQLPLKTRSYWNRLLAFLKDKTDKNLVRMRDIKIIRPRKQNISEFFRNLPKKETGGTINHVLETPKEGSLSKHEVIEQSQSVVETQNYIVNYSIIKDAPLPPAGTQTETTETKIGETIDFSTPSIDKDDSAVTHLNVQFSPELNTQEKREPRPKRVYTRRKLQVKVTPETSNKPTKKSRKITKKKEKGEPSLIFLGE
jgi:hypothetical protein